MEMGELRAGDVAELYPYDGTLRFRVLRDPEPWTDTFGREMQRVWAADDAGREGWVPFGPGGQARRH